MKQFNERLLNQTGGWHIIIVIAASQIIGLLGAVPGFAAILLIADFNEAITQIFSYLIPVLIIISQIFLLGICWWSTSNARELLSGWRKTGEPSNSERGLIAWKEITNLTTRYGISSFFINFAVIVLPSFLIAMTRSDVVHTLFQPPSINAPVPFYILPTGLAFVLGSTIFSLLLIERFTLPDRLILLPKDFESQIKGRTGALLGIKFQTLILGIIVVGITVIVPLGYHQTIKTYYAEISSLQVVGDLQFKSLLLGGLILALGIGFSLLATHSISSPLKELIETFQKVEEGDLNQRVPVTGIDELATVAVHFNRMVSRLDKFQLTLEEQVAERTKQLTATNQVGRVASSILEFDELLNKTVNLIAEQFNYYYVAIFILDPSEKWAELKEATGQAGSVLKKNRHRLEISGKSMVAGCIRDKIPRLAQNTADEKLRFENPLLPYTRSEVALPLIVGDRLLGALNVQSTKLDDFGEGVIETMQNMASQVAIALENARLFEEARQSIVELRAIQKQYLLEGWSSIRTYNDDLEYGVGESAAVPSQRMESSIKLRDQILGTISLEQDTEWTPEQQSLVDAVTAQAAIALENARLVSESRQVALRERMLTDINSKIWASTSVEAVLQTVAKELGKRLDTSATTIELNLDDES